VSDVATVSILVDTAPECDDRSATVESGRQLTLTDIPCQDGDGDTLDIFVSDPQHGTLDIAGDGSSVTYTPAPGYVGPDAITYQAQDVLGLSSTTRTLTITVTTPPLLRSRPHPRLRR
jgi:large repetitive protein